jgi:uncharacterized protein YeeX (DUF496 family)
MTLDELIRAVDRLSDEELRQLRDYVNQRQVREQDNTELRAGTMNVDALMRAVDQIREGLTEQEIETMIAAMNEEYIEPFAEAGWRE